MTVRSSNNAWSPREDVLLSYRFRSLRAETDQGATRHRPLGGEIGNS